MHACILTHMSLSLKTGPNECSPFSSLNYTWSEISNILHPLVVGIHRGKYRGRERREETSFDLKTQVPQSQSCEECLGSFYVQE